MSHSSSFFRSFGSSFGWWEKSASISTKAVYPFGSERPFLNAAITAAPRPRLLRPEQQVDAPLMVMGGHRLAHSLGGPVRAAVVRHPDVNLLAEREEPADQGSDVFTLVVGWDDDEDPPWDGSPPHSLFATR